MKTVAKFGNEYYSQQMKSFFEITKWPTKRKFWNSIGGRKVAAFEVRETKYDWFLDVKSNVIPGNNFKN